MSANRKAALALAAWLAVLPGLTMAEGYTEGNAAVDQPEEQTQVEVQAEEEPVEEAPAEEDPVEEDEGQPEAQEEPEAEEPAAEEAVEEGKPVVEEQQDEEKLTQEEPSEEEKPTEEKPAEEQPTEEKPAEDPEKETPTGEPAPGQEENGNAPSAEPQTANSTADTLPADQTESPRPVVIDMPEEEDDWKPWGQAWTELDDGERTAGTLGEVLSWLESWLGEDEEAAVYIRTDNEVTADNVSRNLLERVGFEPDGETFNVDKYEYVVLVDSSDVMTLEAPEGAEEDVRVSISVQVQRKNAPAETETPDANVTEKPTSDPNATEKPTPDPNATESPSAEPTATPAPTEEPTPAPKPVIEVTAEGYEPGVWKNSAPFFTLSGIPEESDEYVYAVFICDERLILLANGNNAYMPDEEGMTSVRFAILDKMGDVQSLSDQYDMMLDFTPPDGPYLTGDSKNKKICYVEAYDELSGLDAISYDGGETWLSCNDPETDNVTFSGKVGETVDAGSVWTRDFAGNISANDENFTFGKKKSTGTGTGTGTGTKPIRHVKETMDYSKANYNALELNVSDAPQTELTVGGTALSLSLTEENEPRPFTAELTTWQTAAGEEKTAPNALVLTAATDAQTNVWHFGGEAYKLLYNSGVEYLVFASGDYITVIPTEGFTGGTQYGKLKAGGVSTRKFEYTLIQDEALRETTLSVQVEGETYLLEESTESPMYRYNVLVGTKDMMQKPYESYMPGKEAT